MTLQLWLALLGGVLLFCAGLFRLLLLMHSRRLQRAEGAARRAHDIAAMTLQNMDQGLIMVDAQGKVLVYNQGFLDFTGLAAAEAARCQTFEDFVRRARTAPMPHHVDRVLEQARQGGTHSYEVTLGNARVYDVRQTALATGGFIRTYTDISERKEMERELLQSRDAAESAVALMNTTMQNMDQGILVVDARHRIVMYNDRLLDLLRKDRALVHPDMGLEEFFRLGDVDAASVLHALQMAELGSRTAYELRTLDGRTLAVRQNPLQDGGWVRTYSDITEQKQHEAALRDSKSKAESTSRILETTIENLGQGILMVDRHGGIVIYNSKLVEYLGVDKALVGACKTFNEMVRLGDVPAYFKEKTIELAATGAAGSFEFPFFSGRTLEVTQNPLQEGGWVRTYSDITARKRIEQELQRAMVEAEASSQAKAAFLATMSHEIRTPMNGIIGMVDLLSQSRLSEDQVQVVRTIRESGHALLTILDDILDLSKIEAGKLQLELVAMSIRETVEGAAATLSAFAARNEIQLVVYVDPDIEDRVAGDPVRIRQIIFNLLSNAIKFSPRGSEVLVRVDPVTALDDGDLKAVCFTVTDHGVGIPKRAQANLFESFIQAETSTTRRYGGTGLGLAICKRLTTMMRGSIKFRSVEGEGTTFFIDLKFKPVPAVPGQPQRKLQGLDILLAGSSEMQCFVAARYLECAGACVQPALDMAQLPRLYREACASGRPPAAIVLLDTNQQDRYRRVYGELAAQGRALPPILLAQRAGMLVDNTERLGSELLLETNPLRRDNLVRQVAIACGRDLPEGGEQFRLDDVADVPLPTVEEALAEGRLILVAEDNSINQDVIRRQLNRLGYQCEVAANGREALQWWQTRAYAVVLTDCHMPDMDGFDLTRAIRNEESRSARRRTPVIAITANALKGEAERCISAGMDDYLAKPLKLKSLQLLLHKWLGNATPRRAPSLSLEDSFRRQLSLRQGGRPAGKAGLDALPVLDERVIKDDLGEDPEQFREILGEFQASLDPALAELEQALRRRDLQAVRAAAHKLKSACAIVGAARLAAVAAQLETAAGEQDWHGIDTRAPGLLPATRELRERLAQYR